MKNGNGADEAEEEKGKGKKGSKDLVVLDKGKQVDLVQVDVVFRDGKYSSSRDVHAFLQVNQNCILTYRFSKRRILACPFPKSWFTVLSKYEYL